MRILIITFLINLCCYVTLWADGSRYASESVLSSGKWAKIQVETTGIYKITYDELRKMGFDPEKVSVHGYGGWPLDEDFSSNSKQPYIDDLPATAVFRGTNYILFYGRGPVKWEYNEASGKRTFEHTNNPYATHGAYFITDATPVKDMEMVEFTNNATLSITSYDEYRVHELERVSVNNSGRELFGEFISAGNNTINTPEFNIPGILDEDAKVTIRAIARPRSNSNPGSMTFLLNGNEITNLIFYHSSDSYVKARADSTITIWKGPKVENPKVTVTYNNTGDENVYLDYIRLHVQRELKQYGDLTFFRSVRSINNISRFVLNGANANTVIFDVTDPVNPKQIQTQLNGSELSFTIPAGKIREFVAVQIDRTLTGWKVEKAEVPNQNLHKLANADMIIIVHDALKSQAVRLAERHRNNGIDALTVEIVNPDQIYNEFSSGIPDATAIRRFMKMFYDRSQSGEGSAPKYLLLFGDGAVDNRRLTTDWSQVSYPNMLLTFQSENSIDSGSYVTDDYFGALSDEEFLPDSNIHLGIGRFPVRNISEATIVVDKILNYMDNKITGSWKNRLSFVADDGNADDKYTIRHMSQANQLADNIRKDYPEFLTSKIFFDAYKKENTGGTAAYPGVHDQINKELSDDNGLLMINYVGHGNTQSWSDEKVLDMSDISKYRHTKLPLWITSTCDFTRFDNISTSAGEAIFLSRSGGIALFTTVRVVFTPNNFYINREIIQHLFKKDKDNRRMTLGDVIRETKSNLGGVNKLNFILIGDPAMKLAYPEYSMNITEINGKPVGETPVKFKAQDRVTIRGEVHNPDKNLATDFSGPLEVTILDSKQTLETLDNNNRGEKLKFDDYPNALYIGNHEVTNGVFEFSFIIQKDISYSNSNGLINLYATDTDLINEAQGSYDNFIVGGSSEIPIDDTEGPEIKQIYLNDSTFVSGEQVNTTPLFVARLWDESGVNISGSSVGHDITLTLHGPALSPINHTLNSSYRLLPETENEGLVKFSIPTLEPGQYTAEFRAWDIMNNSTVHEFEFQVTEGIKPAIAEIIATPVPARDNLQFMIYHNRPEATINARVMVYDLSGKLLWTGDESGSSDLHTPLIIDWNLNSTGGARLNPGVYIFRAAISTDNSKEATKAKKLIILAQ